MVGETLRDLRAEIEALAADGGAYGLVCGRTGTRPVPVGGLRFPDRETAAEAAELAERYRAALRRYDPQVPCYDPIVREVPEADRRWDTGGARPLGGGSPDGDGGDDGDLGAGDADRIEFCHRVAGALFEALSAAEYDGVETAVMDAYLDAAERIADPDDLCLGLLERAALELDRRLDPAAQADVVARAAASLPPLSPPRDGDRLAATFERLRTLGLLDGYAAAPQSDDNATSHSVLVRGYAIDPRDARVVTLPVAVEAYRRRPDAPLVVDSAVRTAERSWRLTLSTSPGGTPSGLLAVPIDDGH